MLINAIRDMMVLLASGYKYILARKQARGQTKKDILMPLTDNHAYDISGSNC